MIKKEKGLSQNEIGITLIALVLTIVVLLILAGVAINSIGGNSGVMDKARMD